MALEAAVEEAFAGKNVAKIAVALLGEKNSKSLMNRLDKITSKELDKNEFTNVFILLRAIDRLCETDEDFIQSSIQQGLVVKMLVWFERATEFLKMEETKSMKGLPNLIEEFYDVSMHICRISLEGKCQIQDIFILRFGVLVTDADISFGLRLEAIRTINSILDSSSKEERKKLSLSEDHCFLLEEFAKVILEVGGDYEMQVAISEALCRMTTKKCRQELVYKWFPIREFADSFKEINDREFETDCRKFLNDVNNHFGYERRVFTFPCIKAFLDTTELFKPDDENLDKFWIDFNIGTSCISFFVNDPEGALWESINLPKLAISGYTILERDDQKVLTVQMTIPITHSKIKGGTVQIIFESQYDIENAVKKVFGEQSQLEAVQMERQTKLARTSLDLEKCQTLEKDSLTRSPGLVPEEDIDVTVKRERHQTPSGSPQEEPDVFQLNDHSDTEVKVAVSETLHAICKDLTHIRKKNCMLFVAALRRYQVAKAKARIFSQSSFSKGSEKSIQSGDRQKESHKVWQSESGRTPTEGGETESLHPRGLIRADYTRKKSKVKTKLKILPLSSSSSAEESSVVMHSTPKPMEVEQSRSRGGKPFPRLRRSSLEYSLITTEIDDKNAGPAVETEIEDSVFLKDDLPLTKEHSADKLQLPSSARKRKQDTTGPDSGLGPEIWEEKQEEEQPRPAMKAKERLFSDLQHSPPEKMSKSLLEESDSEVEMESGVIAAFQSFRKQLHEYKKIETRSLKSLSDCQKHVTSLLGSVHKYRLTHLEKFQDTVVNELYHLEQDCEFLKEIEKETVTFWKKESESVELFCDKQQQRLQSVGLLSVNRKSRAEEEEVSASQGPSVTVIKD